MPVKADKQWRRVLTSRVNRLINFHNYILLVASLAAAVSVVVDAVFPQRSCIWLCSHWHSQLLFAAFQIYCRAGKNTSAVKKSLVFWCGWMRSEGFFTRRMATSTFAACRLVMKVHQCHQCCFICSGSSALFSLIMLRIVLKRISIRLKHAMVGLLRLRQTYCHQYVWGLQNRWLLLLLLLRHNILSPWRAQLIHWRLVGLILSPSSASLAPLSLGTETVCWVIAGCRLNFKITPSV